MNRLFFSFTFILFFSAYSQAQALPPFEKQVSDGLLSLGFNDTNQALALGDLNNDKRPEIIAVNPTNNAISILLNNGKGGFSLKGSYVSGISPLAVVLG